MCGAAPLPNPPCAGAPAPPYPALDAAPVVQVWDRAEWSPPACTAWAPSSGATLVATVARFRATGGADALRRRIGAVSGMAGLLYWSATNRQWRPFILDAAALEAAGGPRRGDFSLDEVAPGRSLYLEQEDNLFGKAPYRLKILTATPNRIVYTTENAAPMRYLGLTLAQPGEIQSLCFLDREADGVWRYYAIARTGKAASLLTAGHEASLINRAVAAFRYLAGIAPDREPPAAR